MLVNVYTEKNFIQLTQVLRKIVYTLMPVRRDEIKKCISIGMMYFFILGNYDILRTLKDSLVVTNIGPESSTFIKMYVITPVALSFMLLYTYMSERLSFDKIFLGIVTFFLVFFVIFGFVIFPNQELFHPDPERIDQLINSKLHLFFFNLDLAHFKWFLKLYGKWSFVFYYVMAELWGSAMIFMMYWQFVNHTTKVEDAKRLYPVYGFIAHIGAALAGIAAERMTHIQAKHFMPSFMLAASFCTICSTILFLYNYRTTRMQHFKTTAFNKAGELRSKLTLIESLKIIVSSTYLRLIIVVVLSYGICINLIEGLLRKSASLAYPDTISYTRFYGEITVYTAIGAIAGMVTSGPLLRSCGWLFGALVTPIVMLITGILFAAFFLFGDHLAPYILPYGTSIALVAAWIGAIQNILTKTVKYSFFDITKEMAYIPAGEHLRSKGKAAVDIIGQRWGKSLGAFIQSTLFIIFPLATYMTIAPYLIIVYICIIAIWIFSTKKLHVAYLHKIEEHERLHKD
jgi:AAA family ATP:ADP antiporter